jgi:hypothetical protein
MAMTPSGSTGVTMSDPIAGDADGPAAGNNATSAPVSMNIYEETANMLLRNLTHGNMTLHESLQILCSSKLPNFTRPSLCDIDLPHPEADADMNTLLHVVAILVPVLFGLIVIVGLFGNMLVVVVVAVNQQMRSTTNILSQFTILIILLSGSHPSLQNQLIVSLKKKGQVHLFSVK